MSGAADHMTSESPGAPDSRQALEELAYNLRWAWHVPTTDLFRVIAPSVWDATHNPVAVLQAAEASPDLLAPHREALSQQWSALWDYLHRLPRRSGPSVGYCSAEFAVADCLPIYSGGLGVLAGDHLKAASDLGLPLVGVGLLYRYGYFQQELDISGRQQERYPRLDTNTVPLR